MYRLYFLTLVRPRCYVRLPSINLDKSHEAPCEAPPMSLVSLVRVDSEQRICRYYHNREHVQDEDRHHETVLCRWFALELSKAAHAKADRNQGRAQKYRKRNGAFDV